MPKYIHSFSNAWQTRFLKKKQKQKHDKLKCLEKQSLDASKKHKLPKIGEKLGKMGVISILEEAPLEKRPIKQSPRLALP